MRRGWHVLAVASPAAGDGKKRGLAARCEYADERPAKSVAENPGKTGGSLLFSFVYGVLHALGAGHGKVVITTGWRRIRQNFVCIALTLASSLLQGLVAIVLVVVVLSILALPARQLHLSGYWLEKGSYLLVGALGVLLCWRAVKQLRALLKKPVFRSFTPHHVHHVHHVHHESCGCGHHHLPFAVATAKWRGLACTTGHRLVDGHAALFRGNYGAAVQ